jgi:hypothetical protein
MVHGAIGGGAVLLLGGLLLGACSLVGVRSGTEQPAYEVVDRLGGGAEVRRYGPRLAAETAVPGPDGWDTRGAAFRTLAGYIFGDGRPEGPKIAMTAPVEIDGTAAPGGLVMRFFMPASHTRATLPEPADGRVRIVEVPAGTAAVLRFAGSTGAAAVAAREAELARALAGSAWEAAGPAVAMFYDPPWTLPFLRRNEVAVPVRPRGSG